MSSERLLILERKILINCFNRYRIVWRFKGHANSRARIFVEKWEAELKEVRSEMSTKRTHSPLANFFFSPVSVNLKLGLVMSSNLIKNPQINMSKINLLPGFLRPLSKFYIVKKDYYRSLCKTLKSQMGQRSSNSLTCSSKTRKSTLIGILWQF